MEKGKENSLKDILANAEMTPGAHVLESINEKLDQRDRRRGFITWFGLIVGLLLLSLISIFSLKNNNTEEAIAQHKTNVQQINTENKKELTFAQKSSIESKNETKKSTKNSIKKNKKTINKDQLFTKGESNSTKNIIPHKRKSVHQNDAFIADEQSKIINSKSTSKDIKASVQRNNSALPVVEKPQLSLLDLKSLRSKGFDPLNAEYIDPQKDSLDYKKHKKWKFGAFIGKSIDFSVLRVNPDDQIQLSNVLDRKGLINQTSQSVNIFGEYALSSKTKIRFGVNGTRFFKEVSFSQNQEVTSTKINRIEGNTASLTKGFESVEQTKTYSSILLCPEVTFTRHFLRANYLLVNGRFLSPITNIASGINSIYEIGIGHGFKWAVGESSRISFEQKINLIASPLVNEEIILNKNRLELSVGYVW